MIPLHNQKITLTKVRDLKGAVKSQDPLRSATFEGFLFGQVKVGFGFVVWNDKPLDKSKGADTRSISTSMVQKIVDEQEKSCLLQTMNSEYLLTWE